MKTTSNFRKKILLLMVGVSFAVTAVISADVPFKAGEKLSYDLYYNWGFIWIPAGNAHFAVFETNFRNHPSYLFSICGNSLRSFDKFYVVRDTFVSIANQQTMLPYYYKRQVKEDSYWAKDEYYFSFKDTNKISVVTDCKRKKSRTLDTLSFRPSVTDMVTAIYRMRNSDFSRLKMNDRIPFSIVYDNEQYNLNLRFLGKENIQLHNGEKYRCIKMRPLLIKGAVFKDDEAMTLWVTDDENKIPVMIETKIRVGSLKVTLNQIVNAKYPLTSKIN